MGSRGAASKRAEKGSYPKEVK